MLTIKECSQKLTLAQSQHERQLGNSAPWFIFTQAPRLKFFRSKYLSKLPTDGLRWQDQLALSLQAQRAILTIVVPICWYLGTY